MGHTPELTNSARKSQVPVCARLASTPFSDTLETPKCPNLESLRSACTMHLKPDRSRLRLPRVVTLWSVAKSQLRRLGPGWTARGCPARIHTAPCHPACASTEVTVSQLLRTRDSWAEQSGRSGFRGAGADSADLRRPRPEPSDPGATDRTPVSSSKRRHALLTAEVAPGYPTRCEIVAFRRMQCPQLRELCVLRRAALLGLVSRTLLDELGAAFNLTVNSNSCGLLLRSE